MSEASHPFDQAIALVPQGDGEFLGHTHPGYANFIGPYGGITAAQTLNAVLLHPQRLGEPVAFTVNFAAALADGPFTAKARPARTNRSTQHWIIELLQNGEVVATGTALTAVRRETWSGHEAVMPEVPRPLDVPRTPRKGVEWLHRYDMRFLEGMVPRKWEGQGADESVTRLWVRDEPLRPLDFASLAALADNFFPRIWLRRATQTPIGTVTMTVYFHADSAVLAQTGTSFLLLQAKGQGFRNGYFDHTGQLWNEAGELLATTTQVVYYKE
ncbi:thioesterase family protein [Caenimonas sedimenti]|uniref:Thioesterase family protein n=1 Tax=Caenimonas sedimenti TaxID=2596921 RepID=A0A562ZP20_9BURK|nr:thioesterase family protein [Caenimonas sedimenti]TWO70293.1 thioesterase family protein [Caenimonas sedimenti]